MKKQIRSLAISASSLFSLLAVLCITTTAVAAPSATTAFRLQGGSPQPSSASNADSKPSVAAATKCTKMTPSDGYWVTLADDGTISQTVESYPSGTAKVVSAFDYDCIPAKTKINIVWSIDGEQVLTDNDTPKPTTNPDTYTYQLYMKDGSALSDGEYAVEYYIGQKLVTSGTVTVGDTVTTTTDVSSTTTADVAVQGTVSDSKSKKPISGALVVVLNAGVDAAQWMDNGQDSDVFAYAKTDSKGQFELNNRIPTGTPLPWVIGAKGYQIISQQDYSIDDGADDPYVMNISLVRSK